MKKMWAVYAALAAVVYLVGNTLYVAGSFKSIHPRSVTITDSYPGLYGPEDMQLDRPTGRLYISSADRWRTLRGLPANDAIWLLDVDSLSRPRRMSTDYPRAFHPHGISLFRNGDAAYLFAVNHNDDGNFIERFLIRGDSLRYQRSFSSDMLCCPNDVVAVAEDKFYVTNDHGSPKGFKRTLEDYGRLPYASVLYYNGQEFSTAHEGIQYANGINVNSDGTRLYVAATTGRELLTFERTAADGRIKLLASLPLHTGVDNIDVDTAGDLWIAAHPKLLAFVAHAKDSTKKSPSQVLRLSPQPGKTYQVQEIFMDDGTLLSGSSIAVHYKDELFVGGVFQPRILRLALPSDKPQ